MEAIGNPLNRGVLLDGPPGTGKSLVAKIIMSQNLRGYYGQNWSYIHVVARHITSVDAVRKIYNAARVLNPSVVFIEDIDLIAGTDRTSRQAVKNELMQQLDGLEKLNGVITIGTTNYGPKLDAAIRRAGRLGFHHTLGLPDFRERVELFKVIHKKSQYRAVEI